MIDRSVIVCSIIIIVCGIVVSSKSLFDEDLYQRVLNNVTCQRHLQEMNLMQFYDASGRVPQSIILGGQGSLGNYRQCLSLAQKLQNDTINGKYCMIRVALDSLKLPELADPGTTRTFLESIYDDNNNYATEISESRHSKQALRVIVGNMRAMPSTPGDLAVNVALCIPESCTTEEAIGQYAYLLNVTYQDEYCRLTKDKVFSAVDYIALVTIAILGTLTIFSTGYDFYNCFWLQKDAADISKLLTCCSIYTNTHRLLTFTKAPGSIECLDGIRAISILWVVIGHSFSNVFLNTIVVNTLTAYQWVTSSEAIWLLSAVLSVDTFFMMSGLLVVYTTVKKMTPLSLLKNIHWFYLHRLLRMFPLLGAAVLFQASLAHHSGDGPGWPALAAGVRACRDWWWAALLHVQNYANVTEICLAQTWYLAVDTQLHLLSPLVLFWVLGSRRSAWCALAAALQASLIGAAIYCYIKGFAGPTLLSMGTDALKLLVYFKEYYVNTLTRCPAFVVGMVFGYLLHVWQEHPRRIPKWFVASGWLAAFALGSGMIYFNYPAVELTVFWRNFLNSFMRPLWALSVGWVVFACYSGYGGPINWFLSLTIWKFLARISYALYLFHYPLQAIVRAQSEMPVMFSVTSLLYTFFTDLTLSLTVATVLCVVVDAPFSTLQKILFEGKGMSAHPPSNGVSSSTQNLVA